MLETALQVRNYYGKRINELRDLFTQGGMEQAFRDRSVKGVCRVVRE